MYKIFGLLHAELESEDKYLLSPEMTTECLDNAESILRKQEAQLFAYRWDD